MSEIAFAAAIIRIGLGGMLLVLLFIAEQARPLRRPTQPKLQRWAKNIGIIAVGVTSLAVAYQPVVSGALTFSREAHFGLLQWLRLPYWIAAPLALLAFDYTLWIWHVLNHRVALLWRFHAAHHIDLDLDASTALRFHFGELLLSVPYRAAQVLLIGSDVGVLFLYETLLLLFTEFHHSNVALNAPFEQRLGWCIITPRLHGIHHSIIPGELNSNFGTLLTIWDRLHRTFRRDVDQDRIRIGVVEILDPQRVGFLDSLLLPFRRHRPELAPRSWR